MQQRFDLKNEYFDCRGAFCQAHNVALEKCTARLDGLLCEWGALKNYLSGVGEVNLRCENAKNAQNALKKWNMSGSAVVDGLTAIKRGERDCIVLLDDILSLSEKQLGDIALYCGKHKLPVLINYGRSLYEMGTIDKTFNLSPARFLEEMGFLDRKCALLGANHLDKDDLEILSQYEAKIVLTPQEDGLLGRSAVNLAPMLAKSIELGFASGAFPYVNMLAEVNLAAFNTSSAMNDSTLAQRAALAKCVGATDGDIEAKTLQNALPNVENEGAKARLTELENEILKEIK